MTNLENQTEIKPNASKQISEDTIVICDNDFELSSLVQVLFKDKLKFYKFYGIKDTRRMSKYDQKKHIIFFCYCQLWRFKYLSSFQSLDWSKQCDIMKSVSLQVISSSPADSRIIQQSGADRIQLVSALQIGGVTPSYSTIRRSLQAASLPHHVIIRPHNNGFIFTKEEKSLMLDDILITKDLNAHGVVIGSLIESEQKQIKPDYEFIEHIVKEVGGKMNIVFHKASDLLTLYAPTLSQLTQRGITTILTQGGTKPLLQNTEKLRSIEKETWPKILLGGGITHTNKVQIIEKLNPSQIHIGTCVRTNKYGPVDGNKIQEFLNLRCINY